MRWPPPPAQSKYDLAIQIGLYVYQYNNLHILAFRYEFLEDYFDKRKWQQLYCDTDSMYLSLSVDRLEEACIPDWRRAYFKNHDKWLPEECCAHHKILYVETMMKKEAMASDIRDRGGQVTGAMAWMPRIHCCQLLSMHPRFVQGGIHRQSRPRIAYYNVTTDIDDLSLTVREHHKVPGGNFRHHAVIIRNHKKTYMLTWDEWLSLNDTAPSVLRAQRMLQVMLCAE